VKRIATVLAISFLLAGAAQAAEGKAVYSAKCSACHGPDGKGQSAMAKKLGVKDLTVTALSAAEVKATILSGRNKMPSFEGKLTAEDTQAVVTFVKGGLK
jgi:mono/diheme cytochrome c family protein